MPQDLASKNKELQEQLGGLLKEMQYRRSMYQDYEGTHFPQEEMGAKGKAGLNYIKRVAKGEIAREGLEKMSLDFASGDSEKIMNYFGAGMIAGPKAITANLPKLELAKKLKKLGASRERIWKETGWFQYANDFKAGDKAWKFEIPDVAAATKGPYTKAGATAPAGEKIPLGKAANIPETLEAYPAEVFSSTYQRGGLGRETALGQFIPNQPPLRGGHVQTASGEAGFSILHEIQHMIQRAEAEFIGGSSPARIQRLARETIDPLSKELQAARAARDTERVRVLQEQLFQAADIAENKADIANKLYRLVTGEQEARIVQRRAKMIQAYKGLGLSDTQIRQALINKPPWKSLDPGAEEKMFAPKDTDEMMSALNEAPVDPTLYKKLIEDTGPKYRKAEALKQQAEDFSREGQEAMNRKFSPAVLKDQAF